MPTTIRYFGTFNKDDQKSLEKLQKASGLSASSAGTASESIKCEKLDYNPQTGKISQKGHASISKEYGGTDNRQIIVIGANSYDELRKLVQENHKILTCATVCFRGDLGLQKEQLKELNELLSDTTTNYLKRIDFRNLDESIRQLNKTFDQERKDEDEWEKIETPKIEPVYQGAYSLFLNPDGAALGESKESVEEIPDLDEEKTVDTLTARNSTDTPTSDDDNDEDIPDMDTGTTRAVDERKRPSFSDIKPRIEKSTRLNEDDDWMIVNPDLNKVTPSQSEEKAQKITFEKFRLFLQRIAPKEKASNIDKKSTALSTMSKTQDTASEVKESTPTAISQEGDDDTYKIPDIDSIKEDLKSKTIKEQRIKAKRDNLISTIITSLLKDKYPDEEDPIPDMDDDKEIFEAAEKEANSWMETIIREVEDELMFATPAIESTKNKLFEDKLLFPEEQKNQNESDDAIPPPPKLY